MLLFKDKIDILSLGGIDIITNGYCGNIKNVTFDSRNVGPDSIFFAIEGTQTDGHYFVSDAFKKGAQVAVVNKVFPEYKNFATNKTIIKVNSTTEFMAELAKEYRKHIKCDVIGITGSVGKTTTKDLVTKVLSVKFKVLSAIHSYNNILGLSFTLLNYNDEEKVVLELGVNHTGEMEKLVEIAHPDIAVLTYFAPVHLEGMKSLFIIYDQKKIITRYAKDIYVNSDSPFFYIFAKDFPFLKSAGISACPTYRANIIFQDLNKIVFTIKDGKNTYLFEVPSFNIAVIYSALFAYAIGKKYDIDYTSICNTFKNFTPAQLRNEIIQKEGRVIIADCYNANPFSVEMVLSSFRNVASRKSDNCAFILGDMLELGRYSPFYHIQLANSLKNLPGLKILVGSEIRYASEFLNKYNISHYYFEDVERLIKSLPFIIPLDYKYILLKGSRKLQLERLIEFL